jgi:hypothetical protein
VGRAAGSRSSARISNPKLGRGFFLVDWKVCKLVAGGPESTLEQLEEFLRRQERAAAAEAY